MTNYIKYYFLKYNKTLYIVYSLLIMLFFSTYSTISYCDNEILEKIEENNTNDTTKYIYYSTIALVSIITAFTLYSFLAYYNPTLDWFHLFTDEPKNYFPNTTSFVDRYSFKTLTTPYCDEVDPAIYEHIVKTNLFLSEQNKILTEANLRYQEQLEYLWYKLDVPNLDYLKDRPEPLIPTTIWTPIDKLPTIIEENTTKDF